MCSSDLGLAAVVGVLEARIGEDRRCPCCGVAGAMSRGRANGLRRYACKACGKTFNALTGTPLAGLRLRDRWREFSRCLAEDATISGSAERCGVAISTAFRWRHRFLAAARGATRQLGGIVEADETFVRDSRKGARKLEIGRAHV